MICLPRRLIPASFLRLDAGDPNSPGRSRGRGAGYLATECPGHFQGPARQLTSSANGRAILQGRKSRYPRSPQRKMRCAAYGVNAPAHARAHRRQVMTAFVIFGAISPPIVVSAVIVVLVLLLFGPLVLGSVLIRERQVGIVVKRFASRSLQPGA